MYVLSEKIKNIKIYPMKISISAFEKSLYILHGHVFIMNHVLSRAILFFIFFFKSEMLRFVTYVLKCVMVNMLP